MEQATNPSRTITSELIASIRADIIRGTLAPGSRLRIKELCDRYAAGHIPMREALSRLAATGFVLSEEQRGFRVPVVSAEELVDITDARCVVECEALRRSIEQGGLDWEERVMSAHYRVSRLEMFAADGPGVDAQWERAHQNFHAALLSGSGSKWLETLSGQLRDQTARYRHLATAAQAKPDVTVDATASRRDVPSEHRALLEAALARDAVGACELLRQHFQATVELVLRQESAREIFSN
jgi:GntR family transcriptional regulator, carbon starvation induced regulator